MVHYIILIGVWKRTDYRNENLAAAEVFCEEIAYDFCQHKTFVHRWLIYDGIDGQTEYRSSTKRKKQKNPEQLHCNKQPLFVLKD